MPNIHQAHPTISVADSAPVLRALPAPCLPGQAACNSLCPNTQKLCAPSLARIACEHSNMGRGNKEHTAVVQRLWSSLLNGNPLYRTYDGDCGEILSIWMNSGKRGATESPILRPREGS